MWGANAGVAADGDGYSTLERDSLQIRCILMNADSRVQLLIMDCRPTAVRAGPGGMGRAGNFR